MSDELQNAVGMTPIQVAEALRKKYYDLLQRKEPQAWKEMDSNLRARWGAAVEVLFVKCERQVQMSARDATRSFIDSIVGEGSFKKLPRPMQLLWEAILRHAINLITAGRPVEGEHNTPAELRREFDDASRYDWNEWLVRKMEEEGLQATRSA